MTTTQKNGGAATVPAEGIPRVTPEQVEAAIVKEEYLQHGRTTLCILTLDNGLCVEGVNHGSVDPRLFSAEIGKQYARKGAVDKIWPVLGHRLGDKLALINAAGKPTGEIATFPGCRTYVGTKVVHATPMRRGAYNELRGWTLPAGENGADEGYLVEYTDGGAQNALQLGFNGYISWSPKDVFERAYTTGVAPAPVVEDFITRMETEFGELTEKLGKLNQFRASPGFISLPLDDRTDLAEQAKAMDDYAWVLRRRLRRAQAQKAKAAELQAA